MSWWDKPSLIGSDFYDRRADAMFAGALGVVFITLMIFTGPLVGLALGGASVAGGVVHAQRGRRQLANRTGGPGRCSPQCRASILPLEECDCVCAGYRHGVDIR